MAFVSRKAMLVLGVSMAVALHCPGAVIDSVEGTALIYDILFVSGNALLYSAISFALSKLLPRIIHWASNNITSKIVDAPGFNSTRKTHDNVQVAHMQNQPTTPSTRNCARPPNCDDGQATHSKNHSSTPAAINLTALGGQATQSKNQSSAYATINLTASGGHATHSKNHSSGPATNNLTASGGQNNIYGFTAQSTGDGNFTFTTSPASPTFPSYANENDKKSSGRSN